MKTFTDREIKLVRQLQERPSGTVLSIQQSCPLHSYCSPLPSFRIYRVDDTKFEAQWNEYHKPMIKQTFEFATMQRES
jgi:hypothetical protein